MPKPTLGNCGYSSPSCDGGGGGPPSPLRVYPNPVSNKLTIENNSDIKTNIFTNFKISSNGPLATYELWDIISEILLSSQVTS